MYRGAVTFQPYTECFAKKRNKASRLIQHLRNILAITCPLFVCPNIHIVFAFGRYHNYSYKPNYCHWLGVQFESGTSLPSYKFFTACTAYLYVSGYVQHSVSVGDCAK